MPVDPTQLDRALAQIKSNYGETAIRKGNAFSDPKRVSTGSLELDIITGGGAALGRWHHWYGGKFSAKTMTALKTIANCQRMGLKCAYYNIEKQFSPSWAIKHGVDVDELEVIEDTKIEDIGAIMETLLGSVHVHVLDSLAAAVSIDELASTTDEWRPGISARAWGKVLRRVNERFDDHENMIIMINHVGTVFGKYGGGEEPKGAKFVEYLSSLSLDFRRTSWLFRDKDGNLRTEGDSEASLSGDKTPAGIEFAAKVAKSRVCTPFRTARMRLDFDTGEIDDMWSITKAALLYGLASKTSAKSSWIDVGDEKVQGEYQLRAYIEANPDFKQKVLDKLWATE
jgi:protein RecA